MSKLLGVLLIARNGDRLGLPQDPHTYLSNVPTSTTALGEYNSWKLGESIRRIYVGSSDSAGLNEYASFEDYDPSTVNFPSFDALSNKEQPFDWSGFYEEPVQLHDPRAIHVRVKAGVEGTVVFDSAIALLQGMYPPASHNGVELANSTWVQAPLGGYQYVPVETVEPYNDRSLESWTQCPAFTKHVQDLHKSDKLKKKNDEAKWFWSAIKDYTFGLPTGIENIWNIYDFMNTQLVYNQTYAYRLPTDLVPNARALADYHEDAVFGSSDPKSIANLPARTLLPTIIESLQQISNPNDPLKYSVVSTTYQPFISLFHLLEMRNAKSGKQLKGIPDFASSILVEVRQSAAPDMRAMLRFAFANSSDSRWEAIDVLDDDSDFVPLTEFIYRTQPFEVSGDLKEWKKTCGGKGFTDSFLSTDTFLPEEYSTSDMLVGAFAFLALAAFIKRRRDQKKLKQGAIRLSVEEVERMEKDGVRVVYV